MKPEELLILLCVLVAICPMAVGVHVDEESCDSHQYLDLGLRKCLPCKGYDDVCERDGQCCNMSVCSIHSNNKTGHCCPGGTSWDIQEAECKLDPDSAGVLEAETTTTGQTDSSEQEVGAAETPSSDLEPRNQENETDTYMIWPAVVGAVLSAVIILVLGAVYHEKLKRLWRWLLCKKRDKETGSREEVTPLNSDVVPYTDADRRSEDKTFSTKLCDVVKKSPEVCRQLGRAILEISYEETQDFDFVKKILREDKTLWPEVWTEVKETPRVLYQIAEALSESSDKETQDFVMKLLSEDETCSNFVRTAVKEKPWVRRQIARALLYSPDVETQDFALKLLREDETSSTKVWTEVKKSPALLYHITDALLESSDVEIQDFVKKLLREDKTFWTQMWNKVKKSPEVRYRIAVALLKSSDEETQDFVKKLLSEDETCSNFVRTAVKEKPWVRRRIAEVLFKISDEETKDFAWNLLYPSNMADGDANKKND